jgi:hypothetical protein
MTDQLSKSNLTFCVVCVFTIFLPFRLTSGAFTIASSTPTLRRNLNEHRIQKTCSSFLNPGSLEKNLNRLQCELIKPRINRSTIYYVSTLCSKNKLHNYLCFCQYITYLKHRSISDIIYPLHMFNTECSLISSFSQNSILVRVHYEK